MNATAPIGHASAAVALHGDSQTSGELEAVVRRALDLLLVPLRQHVSERMRRQYGARWVEHALGALHTMPALSRVRREDLQCDLSVLLHTVSKFWHVAFSHGSGRQRRQHFEELREIRNALSHGDEFDIADAFRAVDTAHRLLAVIAPADASRSRRLRAELLVVWASRPDAG